MQEIAITNPKLAALDPRWAPFRGFSLLFENPADRAFYDALQNGISRLASSDLVVSHLLCLLPPVSFHVTVWDGINDGNLGNVCPEYRDAWSRFLDTIPRPEFVGDLFSEVRSSELVSRQDWKLALRCEQVENWSCVSMVARLVPNDAESKKTLAWLASARNDLSMAHGARFGVYPHPDFVPHVTLGYFANRDLASRSERAVAEWNEVLLARTSGLVLRFNRIAPSVFTDMASFGRDPDPPRTPS